MLGRYGREVRRKGEREMRVWEQQRGKEEAKKYGVEYEGEKLPQTLRVCAPATPSV